MDIIFVIIPLTLLLAVVAIVAFAWAVKRNQFEDTTTPAMRILFEENGSEGDRGEPRAK